jgi:uncharacterized protein YjbJ (UPF0337 family)
MNWNQIETGWTSYTANAKLKWDKLSDEQLTGTLGKREQLSSKVQEAYGISKEESERQISEWQSHQLEAQPVQAVK